MITQERLKELLHYDPEEGLFYNKTYRGNKAVKNAVAGCYHSLGYIVIKIAGKEYKAHRLAFLYMNGVIPVEVDHINHIRSDNRWLNLRESNRKDSPKNTSIYKSNTSGITGIRFIDANKKWRARINVNGAEVHLGTFHNKEDAINARKEAEIKYNFHPNHGK
jgi:hypothetical protein